MPAIKYQPHALIAVENGDEWEVYRRPVHGDPFSLRTDIEWHGIESYFDGVEPTWTVESPAELPDEYIHYGRIREIYLCYQSGDIDTYDCRMFTRSSETGKTDGVCTLRLEHSDTEGSASRDRLRDVEV